MGNAFLRLFTVPVNFLNGTHGVARAEGNNATWLCQCGDPLPIMGRCYYAYGHIPHTIHDACGRRYRVFPNADKQTDRVDEY